MKQSSNTAQIPQQTLLARKISEYLLKPLFPIKINDKSRALSKAIHAAKEGKGLLIIFTHFSLRDAMEVNRSLIFKSPVLKTREVINPLAYYQYNKFLKAVGEFYHGTFYPIVNTSTIERKGFEHLPRGKGLIEFANAAGNLLSRGGVVTLAVNATRKEKLDLQDPQKPIGYFIAATQAKGIDNYAILPVGFELKNAKSYTKKEVGGMNFGKTYKINIGNYYPLKELLNHPEVNNKASNVDIFIREQMTKLVAKEYL